MFKSTNRLLIQQLILLKKLTIVVVISQLNPIYSKNFQYKTEHMFNLLLYVNLTKTTN